KSLGRKKKAPLEYRIEWNDVTFQPGELKAVAYKNGRPWASDDVKTAGPAAKIVLTVDRKKITADGRDLSFITATIEDKNSVTVPLANTTTHFDGSATGEIVPTDNGDATDLTASPSHDRNAFNGLALAIVRCHQTGAAVITASSPGLEPDHIKIKGN